MSVASYLHKTACARDEACIAHGISLLTADIVDLDLDISSNTLTVSGVWNVAPERSVLPRGWVERIEGPALKADQVEFGLLGTEKGIDADEIKVGGLLAVVGKDKKLSTLDPMAASCMAIIGASQLT